MIDNQQEIIIKRGISRRKFIALTGGALGTACIACTGIPLLGIVSGGPVPPPFEMINTEYGEENIMAEKVLVAYASMYGSTAGVADAIGKQLAADGLTVDVRQVKDVTNLDEYRSVVIGSAVQSGAWLPEAVDFVQKNKSKLKQIPTAYFLVCMMATKETEESNKFISEFLAPVRQILHPVAEGRFAGALFPSRQSFFDGLGLRIFLAYLKLKEGDYRNWDAIRQWAAEIKPLLSV